MRCVILQPSYVPWRGFFHQIQKADVFVFYDDVQYDKNGWRNRNRIKSSNASMWLTIPIRNLGLATPINQVPIDWRQNWTNKHFNSLRQNYANAPFFKQYEPLLRSFYDRRDELLADFTIATTISLAAALGISKTQFLRSSTISTIGTKTDRVMSVLNHLGATHYISGPSARGYIESDKFRTAGITLEYIDYNYAEYPQLHPPFDPQVSVLDLLFSIGPEAGALIWGG